MATLRVAGRAPVHEKARALVDAVDEVIQNLDEDEEAAGFRIQVQAFPRPGHVAGDGSS